MKYMYMYLIQVHALVFPNACTHLHLRILGLYFVGAFSFPAVLRSAIQTHRNHFRAHIVTLQTLNIALISYCGSVLVLLRSEDDGPEKHDAIRAALAEILYRLVCVIAASVLRNTCEAALGDDNVPPLNEGLHNVHDDGFENVPVPVNGNEASAATICSANVSYPEVENVSPCVTGSDDPEVENVSPCVTGSDDPEVENVSPCVTGSDDPEVENVSPCVTGSNDPEVENVSPRVTGSIDPEVENVSPCITGSDNPEVENVSPCITGSNDSEFENVSPCVTGSINPEVENVSPRVTGSINPEVENVSPCVTGSIDPEVENVSPCVTGSDNPEVENVSPCVTGSIDPITDSSLHLIVISEDRNQLLTGESFFFSFQNQNPPDDTPMTPQIVDDAPWMIQEVNEVGGIDELVV